MPFFTTRELRERSQRTYHRLHQSASLELREAAAEYGTYDFFLSHSFRDADVIRGLRGQILDMRFSVYVDWVEDTQLDRSSVTKHTADLLRDRMKRCKALLYASSLSAPSSVWMPWETGYFDAHQGRVAILPIFEADPHNRQYKGQEYLDLYPYIIKDTSNLTGQLTLWVHETKTPTSPPQDGWTERSPTDVPSFSTGAELIRRQHVFIGLQRLTNDRYEIRSS